MYVDINLLKALLNTINNMRTKGLELLSMTTTYSISVTPFSSYILCDFNWFTRSLGSGKFTLGPTLISSYNIMDIEMHAFHKLKDIRTCIHTNR